MTATDEQPVPTMKGPLTNQQYEQFARGLVRGMTQKKAYAAAGFANSSGGACKMAGRDYIVARVAELTLEAREIRAASLEETIRALLTLANARGVQGTAAGVKEARLARLEAWRLNEVLFSRNEEDFAPPRRKLSNAEWLATYAPKPQ